MPERSDLPVSVLRPWLGNLALIDLSGDAPHFRLCGTGLQTRFGGEMTGQKIEAVKEPHGRRELLACIQKARQTLTPSPQVQEIRSDHNRTIFHELCLPLGHEKKQPGMMLFVSYAEQKR